MINNNKIKAGYKLTEIGVIPEDWEIELIKDKSKITTGSRNTQDKIQDGKYPFFVRSQTVERINSFAYDGEAVLTAGDGVGTGKVFHYINDKFDFHQRVYKISDFHKTLNGYFFYLYFSNHFYRRIMQMTAKSSVDSVRMDMIEKMSIPIPPINEQKAIANTLSDTDELISSLEKLIAKKKAIKQGAMQELLKPKEGWEVKKLGEIGQLYGGLSGKSKADFIDGEYPYIPFMNIMKNPIIDTGYLDYVKVVDGEIQNRVMKTDLLFNGSSETPEEVGMCSVILADIPNLFLNSFCFGFRLHKSFKINALYLSYYFRSFAGRNLFYSMAQGATRYNLSKSNFVKLEIPLPNIDEQNEIAKLIYIMDSEITALEKKLEKYKNIKLGMMQVLLTGKVRLTNNK